MFGNAKNDSFALLLSTKQLPFFDRQNKYFLYFMDSRNCFFDDPLELLRRARTRFRSTKRILLARQQFIKNIWNCTRNGFGTRKPPAERPSRPNVLYLWSAMPQDVKTPVFIVPEQAAALKLRVSSSEKRPIVPRSRNALEVLVLPSECDSEDISKNQLSGVRRR